MMAEASEAGHAESHSVAVFFPGALPLAIARIVLGKSTSMVERALVVSDVGGRRSGRSRMMRAKSGRRTERATAAAMTVHVASMAPAVLLMAE